MSGSILVVEDDEAIATVLARVLGRLAAPVETVARGAAAVERVRRGGVAMVLLDLGLPDLDGVDVCRRVRAGGFTGPVLVVTAEHEARGSDALGAGADDVLAKPFRLADLVARAGALLPASPSLPVQDGG